MSTGGTPVGDDGADGATEKGRRAARTWYLAILAFIVVVAVVVTAAVVVNRRSVEVDAADEVPAATPVVDAAPASGQDATGTADSVSSVLSGPAADEALGQLSGHVTDVATGQELWSSAPDNALVPASATKLTTATAALLTLPVDDRVATTVRAGTEPGQVVLVGGGDITLQRTEGSGFFTDAPTVADLADQVSTALGGQKVTSVVVDNSVREDDLFNSTWSTDEIAAGNVAPLGGVMVDAGRLDPTENYSPRSGTPAADAGKALADALGAGDAQVSVSGTAVPTAEGTDPLGTVWSAPLGTRLRDMMLHSDNLLAEAVGREVAAARGLPQTFDGATRAVLDTLGEVGVPVDGAVLKDCSGMSADNRLTARILDSVLSLAAGAAGTVGAEDGEDADRAGELRLLLDALPVAAADGTLVDRYLAGSGAEAAAGRVRAKTGTLDGVNALAGTLTTDSGRVLTFAFLSNGSDQDAGRAALDRLAAALRRI